MREVTRIQEVLRGAEITDIAIWRQMALGTGSSLEIARRNATSAGKTYVAAVRGIGMVITAEEHAALKAAGARDLGRKPPSFRPGSVP
jgi:hypothetical protein